MTENLTWDDFASQIRQVIKISDRLNDKWILETKNDDPGGTFLRYKQMKSVDATKKGTIFSFDYHVVYSLSYSVPMFYFNVQDTDSGELLTLEEFRKIFVERNELDVAQEDLNQVLTQMEHPLFFRPFLALHPCKTRELLAESPVSLNKILTFVSLYGPFIFLNLDLEYGSCLLE